VRISGQEHITHNETGIVSHLTFISMGDSDITNELPSDKMSICMKPLDNDLWNILVEQAGRKLATPWDQQFSEIIQGGTEAREEKNVTCAERMTTTVLPHRLQTT
jgi:hypothetical protein